MVERDGREVAALVHDPAVDEEPQVLASVATAAGVFLQNERLQASFVSSTGSCRPWSIQLRACSS